VIPFVNPTVCVIVFAAASIIKDAVNLEREMKPQMDADEH